MDMCHKHTKPWQEVDKEDCPYCEVERLKKIETVARQLIDGSHPCFVLKHEWCEHNRYGYEGCPLCYDEALLEALEGK